jgi:catechol-2,3-dioxygenase
VAAPLPPEPKKTPWRCSMKSRIRHIAIIVPDAEEAAQFYEKAFGFTRPDGRGAAST